jgi:hypothetical protein
MAGHGESLLSRLVGTELNQVIFVMDYMQIGFQDGNSSPILNCYVWPVLRLPAAVYREPDLGYADALRSLITRTVTTATEARGTGLSIGFSGESSIVLDPARADLVGPEIALLQGFPGPVRLLSTISIKRR